MKYLYCGRVIVGHSNKVLENVVLCIEDSKIINVLEESEFESSGKEIIDFSKKTVIPGLIDTHLHFALGPGEVYEEQFNWSDGIMLACSMINARITLDSGVTTARDLGTRNRIAFDLKKAADKGIIESPRLLVCGRSITITGGHFHYCNAEADGYEEVRKVTRKLLKEGADFIKIMTSGGGTKGTNPALPSYSTEEITAAVEEAHKQGKTVTAHAHATKSIINSIEAGVDIIEHCTFLEQELKNRKHLFHEDIAKKIVDEDIYVDNVLSLGSSRFEEAIENFLKFRKLGAKILPGTDGLKLYQTGVMPLMLEMMVRLGVPSIEAIQSATSLSAESIGLEKHIGSIEVGKYADLVAYDENPLDNILVMRNPSIIIKGGTIIPPSDRKDGKKEFKKIAADVLSRMSNFGY